MREVQKYLAIFTGFLIGYGFGDVIKGKDFNQYLLCAILFLFVLNLTIQISKSE